MQYCSKSLPIFHHSLIRDDQSCAALRALDTKSTYYIKCLSIRTACTTIPPAASHTQEIASTSDLHDPEAEQDIAVTLRIVEPLYIQCYTGFYASGLPLA